MFLRVPNMYYKPTVVPRRNRFWRREVRIKLGLFLKKELQRGHIVSEQIMPIRCNSVKLKDDYNCTIGETFCSSFSGGWILW